jgi:hypothetical protein
MLLFISVGTKPPHPLKADAAAGFSREGVGWGCHNPGVKSYIVKGRLEPSVHRSGHTRLALPRFLKRRGIGVLYPLVGGLAWHTGTQGDVRQLDEIWVKGQVELSLEEC